MPQATGCCNRSPNASPQRFATPTPSDGLGGEFVILIDGGTLDVAPQLFAQRVLEAMRRPFALDAGPRHVVVTASIGIATAANTPGDALRSADIALYEAKAAGRDRYEIFRPEMEATIRMATGSTSTDALDRDDLIDR